MGTMGWIAKEKKTIYFNEWVKYKGGVQGGVKYGPKGVPGINKNNAKCCVSVAHYDYD